MLDLVFIRSILAASGVTPIMLDYKAAVRSFVGNAQARIDFYFEAAHIFSLRPGIPNCGFAAHVTHFHCLVWFAVDRPGNGRDCKSRHYLLDKNHATPYLAIDLS